MLWFLVARGIFTLRTTLYIWMSPLQDSSWQVVRRSVVRLIRSDALLTAEGEGIDTVTHGDMWKRSGMQSLIRTWLVQGQLKVRFTSQTPPYSLHSALLLTGAHAIGCHLGLRSISTLQMHCNDMGAAGYVDLQADEQTVRLPKMVCCFMVIKWLCKRWGDIIVKFQRQL